MENYWKWKNYGPNSLTYSRLSINDRERIRSYIDFRLREDQSIYQSLFSYESTFPGYYISQSICWWSFY